MTQRLYYFLDLFTPAWEWIKLHTFRGQMKKLRIVNHLQLRQQGECCTQLELMMLGMCLLDEDASMGKAYDERIKALTNIVNSGISIDARKIIHEEMHRQKCDTLEHLCMLAKNEMIDKSVTDKLEQIMYIADEGIDILMCDVMRKKPKK